MSLWINNRQPLAVYHVKVVTKNSELACDLKTTLCLMSFVRIIKIDKWLDLSGKQQYLGYGITSTPAHKKIIKKGKRGGQDECKICWIRSIDN